MWFMDFPEFDWPSISHDLIGYVEALISRAVSYEPEIVYNSAELIIIDDSFSVSPYQNILESCPLAPEYASGLMVAADSENFLILVEINIDSETQKGYLSNVVIRTIYNSQVVSIDLDQSSFEEYNSQNRYF